MDKLKILFDTDIGTDVDDALALTFLLNEPRCELLGITTCTGEAEERAKLASMLCLHANRPDIPIYPGPDGCLVVDQIECSAPQKEVLSKWPHQKEFRKGYAIEFLRKTIRENPGEITLIAVGPMTNIALLFSVDPEIPKLLKGLYLMCGQFSNVEGTIPDNPLSAFINCERIRSVYLGICEMNAFVDPHATSIVYRAPVKEHHSVGVDLTRKIVLNPDEFFKIFDCEKTAPLMDMTRIWFQHADDVAFHDPSSAVSAFYDDVVEYEKGNVNVDLDSRMFQGYIDYRPTPEGKHWVSKSINGENLFRHYRDILGT